MLLPLARPWLASKQQESEEKKFFAVEKKVRLEKFFTKKAAKKKKREKTRLAFFPFLPPNSSSTSLNDGRPRPRERPRHGQCRQHGQRPGPGQDQGEREDEEGKVFFRRSRRRKRKRSEKKTEEKNLSGSESVGSNDRREPASRARFRLLFLFQGRHCDAICAFEAARLAMRQLKAQREALRR